MCNEFFEKTTTRDYEGRFVVKLPFKIDREKIGDSRARAIANLKRVEQKYDSDTRKPYIDFMREYGDLRHMSPIPLDTSEHDYYIPHWAVLRPSSATTKLRVLFNASAKSSSNLSVNDCLMVGPSI